MITALEARLVSNVPVTEQKALEHLAAIDGSPLPVGSKMPWVLWTGGAIL
jgi:hypothetical protein